MAEHQLAQLASGVDRLDVGQAVGPGGAVSGVPDREVGTGPLTASRGSVETGQRLLVEYLADQAESLVERQPRPVRGGNPCRLLAAVLKGMQPDVGQAGHRPSRRVEPHHSALLAGAVGVVQRELRRAQENLGCDVRQGRQPQGDQCRVSSRGTPK